MSCAHGEDYNYYNYYKVWNRQHLSVFVCLIMCVCFGIVRRLARKRRNDGDTGSDSTGLSHKVHICSVNNFPTAAGLASSAAGFACLGKC